MPTAAPFPTVTDTSWSPQTTGSPTTTPAASCTPSADSQSKVSIKNVSTEFLFCE
jgi:hypothetical protein